LIEEALNWVDPEDPKVSAMVEEVKGLLQFFPLFKRSSHQVQKQGVGTMFTSILGVDPFNVRFGNTREQIFYFKGNITAAINAVLSPLVDVEELTFSDANDFFVETANNVRYLKWGAEHEWATTDSPLFKACLAERGQAASSLLCEGERNTACSAYCKAYGKLVKNMELQKSLLEFAINPPTAFRNAKASADQLPWYVERLRSSGIKLLANGPPNFNEELRPFTHISRCFYGQDSEQMTGETLVANGEYRACSSFRQTVTDVGVCSTYHPSALTEVLRGDEEDDEEALAAKGTFIRGGLRAVVHHNLPEEQRSLVEPVLARVHDRQSFASFFPSDAFVDADQQPFNVPIMLESGVAVSAKVTEVGEGFEDLSKVSQRPYATPTRHSSPSKRVHEYVMTSLSCLR